MKNTIPLLLVIVVPLLTASCSSTVSLTNNAKSIGDKLTEEHAQLLLDQWSKPTGSRGGFCITDLQASVTSLDYEVLPEVSGSTVSFFAYYAKVDDAHTASSVVGGTGKPGITSVRQQSTVELRSLEEIRVVETSPVTLNFCQRFKLGYLVVVKPEESLPSGAELTFNASDQQQLDYILAMLKFYSPGARVVSGVAM